MSVRSPIRAVLLGSLGVALTGCAGFPFGKTPPDTYDLAAFTTPSLGHGAHAPKRQILVPTPSALKSLDSNKVLIHTSPSAIQYLSKSQWSDQLPNIVQAKLIQALEDSNRVGGVGRPGDGLAIDYRLLTDIRAFDVSTVGAPTAHVVISAKILNDRDGVVMTQKVFEATAPVVGAGNEAFIRALNTAFDQVAGEIVNWTLGRV